MIGPSRRALAGVVVWGVASATALGQNAALDRARAAAEEMARDATARMSWRDDDAGVAGHRNGRFFISDSTGSRSLNIGGSLRTRFLASLRSDDAPLTGDSDLTTGFEASMARLHVSGNAGSPELAYRLQGVFSADGAMALEDAWVRMEVGRGGSDGVGSASGFRGGTWAVKAGQYTANLLREQNVADEGGLLVERSQVNEYFNQGRTQGVEASYEAQQFRAFAGVTDGVRSAMRPSAINSPFDSMNEADVALHARAEWMFAGSDWARFERHSSWRGAQTLAGVLGGALAWQSFGDTGAATPGPDGTDFTATLDASVQGSGWNTMLAFVLNKSDPNAGPVDFSEYGLVAQGGLFVDERFEIVGRCEWLRLDPLRVTASENELVFLTFGMNFYPIAESAAARFSADIVYSVEETSGLVSPVGGGDGATGLLGDASAGEMDLRVQFVLRF